MRTLITLLSGLIILGLAPQPTYAQSMACSQHPSGISTPSAKDPAFVDQEAYQREGATWDYRWEADCSQGCSQTSDCPQNTANQPAVKVNDSNWCFQFTDGNRCMMLTTTDKSLGQDKNASGGKYGQYGATPQTGSSGSQSSGTSQSSQPGNMANPEADTSPACKEPEVAQKAFYDAKVANNLVRFNAIIKGVPELCVPADLGATEKPETAAKGIISGRLLLCSGAAKSGGLPDLVWRIVVGGNLFKPDKESPVREGLEEGFKTQLDAAKAKVGL